MNGRWTQTLPTALAILLWATAGHAQNPSEPNGAESAQESETEPPPPVFEAADPVPYPTAAPTNECVPECREGFTCVEGQCVSACNPPCAAGTQCDARSMCVAPGPTPSGAEPHDRAGGSFAAGLEFDYARPIYLATYLGDEYSAHGPAVSFGANFRFDYGFTDRVFLGARVDIGRILTSDDSTGTSLRAGVGLALTFFATKGFFLGIDFGVSYMSYDDISVTFADVNRFDVEESEVIADLDGETLVMLNAGLHFGGLFSISDRVGIYTELRLRSSVKTLVLEGVDVDHYRADGGCCDTDEPDTVLVPAVSLGIGTRLFF